MLTRGSVHFDPGGRGDIHADLAWIVDPHLVFDNLGVESCLAKLLRYVVRRGLVLGSARHVRGLGQGAKVLFRELGIGNAKKTGFCGVLRGSVTKTEDRLWRGGLRRVAANNR